MLLGCCTTILLLIIILIPTIMTIVVPILILRLIIYIHKTRCVLVAVVPLLLLVFHLLLLHSAMTTVDVTQKAGQQSRESTNGANGHLVRELAQGTEQMPAQPQIHKRGLHEQRFNRKDQRTNRNQ